MNTPEHWRASRQIAAWLTGRTAKTFRILAWLFIGCSLYLFAHAAYDQDRGIADPPYVPGRYTPYDQPAEYRDTDPAKFRSLMNYEWACSIALLALSLIHISEPTRLLSISYA